MASEVETSRDILIDDAISADDFVNTVIVEASKNSSHDSKEYNCQKIKCVVSGFCWTYIKHDQTSFPK